MGGKAHDFCLQTSLLVLLGSIDQKVANTPRVAPLVVVPCNELHEPLVQHDSSSSVKDRACWMTNEISGDNCILSVCNNALKLRGLGGSLHGSLDVVVGRGLFKTHDQVDDGYIKSGDTESETTTPDDVSPL